MNVASPQAANIMSGLEIVTTYIKVPTICMHHCFPSGVSSKVVHLQPILPLAVVFSWDCMTTSCQAVPDSAQFASCPLPLSTLMPMILHVSLPKKGNPFKIALVVLRVLLVQLQVGHPHE
jgi:hypothetical protein